MSRQHQAKPGEYHRGASVSEQSVTGSYHQTPAPPMQRAARSSATERHCTSRVRLRLADATLSWEAGGFGADVAVQVRPQFPGEGTGAGWLNRRWLGHIASRELCRLCLG